MLGESAPLGERQFLPDNSWRASTAGVTCPWAFPLGMLQAYQSHHWKRVFKYKSELIKSLDHFFSYMHVKQNKT